MADPRHQALAEALRRYQEEGHTLVDKIFEEKKAPVRRRALLLLNSRQRSRSELRERLLRLDFEEGLVDAVLEDCAQSGLVDDRAFAAEWVRQRHTLKQKSATVLDRELTEKGVAPDIRAEVLASISADDEHAAAWAAAEKKAKSIKAVPADRQEETKHLRRILGVLARKGFASAMSMDIATEVLAARIRELSGT